MKKRTLAAHTPSNTKKKATGTPRTTKPAESRRSQPQPKPHVDGESAARLIDQRIRDLDGWRGKTLARMRALILQADPGITEEWKWQVPVWSHHGIVCTGEAYEATVKLTFAHGAGIPDPARLFNASLEGNTRRAIDIREDEIIDAHTFTTLVQAAVARNAAAKK